MILPANKGRVTVVMNKNDCYEKCNKHLKDEKTYQKLKSDPTNKFKKEFVSNLKDPKDRRVIDNSLHMKLYPTVDKPPKFYAYLRYIKPLCP